MGDGIVTNDEMYKRVGMNIAYYRKLSGLTQEALAEKSYISRGFISRIESPNIKETFSVSTLFDIARGLEVAPYKLLLFWDQEDLENLPQK